MKLGTTLTSLGLRELPQDASMDGFDNTIVFVFPRNIAQFMQKALDTLELPEAALLRNGVIENAGKIYARQNVHHSIPYSLLFFDKNKNRLSCVQNEVGKKVRGVLGNKHQYVLTQGEVFTAAKYFHDWENKFSSGRINLKNL